MPKKQQAVKTSVLEIDNRTYRLRRSNPDNIIIEVASGKGWETVKYFGKLEDACWGLIKLTMKIPLHDDLVQQIKLLRQELKRLEEILTRQISA